MNTRDLEAFLAVVETGSIVAASARLNLTQPGVTRRVQSLEETLGATLLDRQSKPLRPTAAGREAYEHGRRVLRSLDDLRAGVAADGEIRGEFRIGVTPYLSERALAQPFDRLRAGFPGLGLQLATDWSLRLIERMNRGELDAAAVCFTEGLPTPEGYAALDLGTQPALVIAARDCDIPEPASLADLARFGWIMNQDGCGFRTAVRRRFEAARLPFRVTIEANSTELRVSLVARGLGLGLVTPAAYVRSAPADKVRIVDAPDLHPEVRGWVLHRPPAGRLARPIALFHAALVEELAAAGGKRS